MPLFRRKSRCLGSRTTSREFQEPASKGTTSQRVGPAVNGSNSCKPQSHRIFSLENLMVEGGTQTEPDTLAQVLHCCMCTVY